MLKFIIMKKRPVYPLIIAAVSLAVFIPLLSGVITHAAWISTVDHAVVQVVTAYRPTWLTAIVLVITNLGDPPVVVIVGLIVAAVLFYFRRRRYAWFAFASICLMSLVNHIIKNWIRRPRPFVQDPRITPLTTAGGWSFPSGHASGSMLLYGTVILIALSLVSLPRARHFLVGFSTVMIILIGVSRIYVQVHFPTDVFAGWSSALAGLMLLWWLMYPWLTAVGPTGWAGPQHKANSRK
ncbi:membrane-associated phospholipid phosphatase [Lacticaseibacillus camelliae DSM 22697 = JCM 13995]|uniref:Membrane-associated phospholipid phosphatase n=2 Tax=Lacticaseibacillus camelliae TaxID=381742 RepID=A0A0R2F3A1_9LACO|nr:membrane-associated phospholipid phosphatase [Lacticaseibacillus camelliae DSM 22697 = JCM 13995]